MLKQLIKDLAIEQRLLKQCRKTGKYEIMRNGSGYAILPENVRNANAAATNVQRNKIRITAALNLCHEIRGSDYRHNYLKAHEYQYNKEYEKLKLALVPNGPVVEAKTPVVGTGDAS